MNQHSYRVYGRIDGRSAYRPNIKRLTLGKKHKHMQTAAQFWAENAEGALEIRAEPPLRYLLIKGDGASKQTQEK